MLVLPTAAVISIRFRTRIVQIFRLDSRASRASSVQQVPLSGNLCDSLADGL